MTPSTHSPAPASSSSGCAHYLLFAGAALLVGGLSLGYQAIAWNIDQILLAGFGIDLPGWVWLPISWGQALTLALPVGLLAWLVQAPAFRAAYQAWAAALVYIAVVALARVFPRIGTQPAALAQIVLSLLFALGLFFFLRWRGRGSAGRPSPAALGLALAVVPLASLPVLLWGALGSLTDNLLNLLAGLSLGLVAGLILDGFLFRPLAALQPAPWPLGTLLFAGTAAGVALAILGSGFGFGGSQLLLMLFLPPLGYAAAAVAAAALGAHPRASTVLPLSALLGLAAAVPLLFVDPDELMLILGGNEILAWALRAAFTSIFISLLAGALACLAVAARRPRPAVAPATPARPGLGCALTGGLAALAWLAALATYQLAGQPGLYGDRLFVILREQADLSAAPALADRNERLAFVYDTLVAHADSTQAGLRATLDRLGVAYRPYYLVNAIEVDAGPILRLYLELQPGVDRVLPSPRLRPLPEPLPLGAGDEPAPSRPQWNLTSIGADRVWEEFGITGEGIVVGQSDSGVQGDHPALAARYRGRDEGDAYNWLDPWNGTAVPTDVGGHGTHTLGSILGEGIGVAPGAEWFGCVNLARNLANPALYLDCLQFMLAPHPPGGDPLRDGDPARAAHVINNSWGCPPLEGCDAASLEPAVAGLRAAGIFVVVSAGNDGLSGCSSLDVPPAIYDAAFSIGAVDEFGNLADFSSRGPVTVDGSQRTKPDLAAPGVDVWSALPGSTYGLNSGTSMAGPHVAGAVALLWSANPDLIGDIDRTEQILIQSAQPYTGVEQYDCDAGAAPTNGAGYGLLDAYAAVSLALAAP